MVLFYDLLWVKREINGINTQERQLLGQDWAIPYSRRANMEI